MLLFNSAQWTIIIMTNFYVRQPGAEAGVSAPLHLVVFMLEGQRYALLLAAVARIVRAVEITPLPGAPSHVSGVMNLQGAVIPVLNVRSRLQFPAQEIGVEDKFIIAHTGQRLVALVVDDVRDVIEREPADVMRPDRIASGLEQYQGIAKLDDDLVLIYDLEQFFSLQDTRTLDAAMDSNV